MVLHLTAKWAGIGRAVAAAVVIGTVSATILNAEPTYACIDESSPTLAEASQAVFIGTIIEKRPISDTTIEYGIKITEHIFGARIVSATIYGESCGFGFDVGDRAVFVLGDLRHANQFNSAAFRFNPDGTIREGILHDVPRVKTVSELLRILRARLPDTSTAAPAMAPPSTESGRSLVIGLRLPARRGL